MQVEALSMELAFFLLRIRAYNYTNKTMQTPLSNVLPEFYLLLEH